MASGNFLPKCAHGCGALRTNLEVRDYFLQVISKVAKMDGCKYLVFLLENDHSTQHGGPPTSMLQLFITIMNGGGSALQLFGGRTAFCNVVQMTVVRNGGTQDLLRSDNAVTRYVKNLLSIRQESRNISDQIARIVTRCCDCTPLSTLPPPTISVSTERTKGKRKMSRREPNDDDFFFSTGASCLVAAKNENQRRRRKWSLAFLRQKKDGGDSSSSSSISGFIEEDVEGFFVIKAAGEILDSIQIPGWLSGLACDLREKFILHQMCMRTALKPMEEDAVEFTVAHSLLLLRVICPMLTEMGIDRRKCPGALEKEVNWLSIAKAVMTACHPESALHGHFRRFVERVMHQPKQEQYHCLNRVGCGGGCSCSQNSSKKGFLQTTTIAIECCEQYSKSVLEPLCTMMVRNTEASHKAGVKRQHANIISLCTIMAISFEGNKVALHNPSRVLIKFENKDREDDGKYSNSSSSSTLTNQVAMNRRVAYERKIEEAELTSSRECINNGVDTVGVALLLPDPVEFQVLFAAMRAVSMVNSPSSSSSSSSCATLMDMVHYETSRVAMQRSVSTIRSRSRSGDGDVWDGVYKKLILLRMLQFSDAYLSSASFRRLIAGIACELNSVFGTKVDVPLTVDEEALIQYVTSSGPIGKCVLRDGNAAALVRIFLYSVPAHHRIRVKSDSRRILFCQTTSKK